MFRVSRVALIISLIMTIFAGQAWAEEPTVTVYIDGVKQQFSEQAPVIKNDRTLVPMKAILEGVGASVKWSGGADQSITATRGNTTFILHIGSKDAWVNGSLQQLPIEAQLINNKTMVPLSVVKLFGDDYVWDGSTYTVTIMKNTAVSLLSTKQIVADNDKKIVKIETDIAQGSGIAVGDGLFLTNYHVIREAKSGKIITSSGSNYELAGIVLSDENNDLAIVKTKQKPGIAAVNLGNYSQIAKGDKVVAIGSPLGLQNTVSEGIVSNLQTQDKVNYIQISVPINHGSSGGALFNEYGQVIGVTSSGYIDTSGDLNFAISTDHAKKWITDLSKMEFSQIPATFAADVTTKAALDPNAVTSSMEQKHNSLHTNSAGDFKIENWDVISYPGMVSIYGYIDVDKYAVPGNAKAIQGDLKIWSDALAQDLKQQYPDQFIVCSIVYQNVVTKEPQEQDGYKLEEINYLGNSKWLISHTIAFIMVDHKDIRAVVRE